MSAEKLYGVKGLFAMEDLKMMKRMRGAVVLMVMVAVAIALSAPRARAQGGGIAEKTKDAQKFA